MCTHIWRAVHISESVCRGYRHTRHAYAPLPAGGGAVGGPNHISTRTPRCTHRPGPHRHTRATASTSDRPWLYMRNCKRFRPIKLVPTWFWHLLKHDALVQAWGFDPVVTIVVWSDFLRGKTDRQLTVMSQTYPDPIKKLLSQRM